MASDNDLHKREGHEREAAAASALDPHILLFEGAPTVGADSVLALLERGELCLDAGCVAVFLERCQHPGFTHEALPDIGVEGELRCGSVDRRRHITWQLEPVDDAHACRELAA